MRPVDPKINLIYLSSVYIDGANVGTSDRKSTSDVYAIGNYQGGVQRFADTLDDYRIYNRALDPGDIQSLVQASNDPPVAAADGYTVNEEETLTVAAGAGVLNNDNDPNGDGMTSTLLQSPAHGTLTFNADGSFTYTPVADYFGTDVFTYRAGDGSFMGNAAQVTLTIVNVDDAPRPVADAYTGYENETLSVPGPGVLANDVEVDGQALSIGAFTQPANGSVTVAADGGLAYVPRTNFVGADAFTYRASDGGLASAWTTVSIQIKPAIRPNPAVFPAAIVLDEAASLSCAVTGGTGVYAAYAWSGPDGFKSAKPDPGWITPVSSGTLVYTLVVTDSEGRTGTAQVQLVVVESGVTIDAKADPTVIPAGHPTTLSCEVSGGSGAFASFLGSGPDGFVSTARDPGSVILTRPGTNTFTVTVADTLGLSATQQVSVVVGVRAEGVFVRRGGIRYRVFSASRLERPMDQLRVRLQGLTLSPGDRLALNFNGVGIGDLTTGDGLTLDSNGRARDMIGCPPTLYLDVRVTYRARRRVISFVARRGMTGLDGAALVQADNGLSDEVYVSVLVDNAPPDGVIDRAAVIPIRFKVKSLTGKDGSVIEQGTMSK